MMLEEEKIPDYSKPKEIITTGLKLKQLVDSIQNYTRHYGITFTIREEGQKTAVSIKQERPLTVQEKAAVIDIVKHVKYIDAGNKKRTIP